MPYEHHSVVRNIQELDRFGNCRRRLLSSWFGAIGRENGSRISRHETTTPGGGYNSHRQLSGGVIGGARRSMTPLSCGEELFTNLKGPLWRILVAVALCLASPFGAHGEEYPSRTVRIIVPYTAGSPNDLLARMIARDLQSRLSSPFIVENKPGGGTVIGTRVFAASPPDGYTLLFSSSSLIVDPILNHRDADLKLAEQFAPVAIVATTSWLLAASPRLSTKTLKEFIAYAKANPSAINFGFAQGTAAQLVGDRFKVLTNAKIVDVPYKGGTEAISDFLGGRIQMLTPTPSTSLPFIRNGQMLALAITSKARNADLPDVPTFRESGLPELTLDFWAGVFAPSGTPPGIINRLNAAINACLQSPATKDNMRKLGFDAKAQSPQGFAAFVAQEIPRWTEIVKSTSGTNR